MKDAPYTDAFGTMWWYKKDGQLHRDNGPAVEYKSGAKSWYHKGICHREDGPAHISSTGIKFYYLNGKVILVDTDEEFFRLVKMKAFW